MSQSKRDAFETLQGKIVQICQVCLESCHLPFPLLGPPSIRVRQNRDSHFTAKSPGVGDGISREDSSAVLEPSLWESLCYRRQNMTATELTETFFLKSGFRGMLPQLHYLRSAWRTELMLLDIKMDSTCKQWNRKQQLNCRYFLLLGNQFPVGLLASFEAQLLPSTCFPLRQ